MDGETNLKQLIKQMKPFLNKGEYVFATVKNRDDISREDIICEFKEEEGITLIIERKKADVLKLKYTYVACWITLKIHSSLEAVGLTAVFSTELAKNSISCNVVAGYYHDHIFINKKDESKAMKVLMSLSKKY